MEASCFQKRQEAAAAWGFRLTTTTKHPEPLRWVAGGKMLGGIQIPGNFWDDYSPSGLEERRQQAWICRQPPTGGTPIISTQGGSTHLP